MKRRGRALYCSRRARAESRVQCGLPGTDGRGLPRPGYIAHEFLLSPSQLNIPNERLRYYCLARSVPNQRQNKHLSAQFVPEKRFPAIDFAVTVDAQATEY
eukprot:2635164-Rhodomonas_salina.3